MSAQEVNLKAPRYTRTEGSPFSGIIASISPAGCGEESAPAAVHYAYSASAPEEALPSCSSDIGQASIDQALPMLAITDSVLDGIDSEEAADGLPDVPIVVNKNVESFIRYFQTNGRKHFEKWLGRSKDYMVMLQSILKENGVPEDLSYIALIESGLNPTVRSHANAVGMWQFIKGTATRYGLRVDWWIDERMDPEKATHAAAKYFKNLYGMFDSWYLAAASYNAGEGRVSRAIKRHGTEDFWELAALKKRSLHRETREYVPKYLAALTIAKDPESYGFTPVAFNEEMMYDKVRVSQATDLSLIADAAGTSVEEIRRLNPELLRWFTPPNYPNYMVKIPAGRTEMYAENMSKVPAAKRIAFLQHKVKARRDYREDSQALRHEREAHTAPQQHKGHQAQARHAYHDTRKAVQSGREDKGQSGSGDNNQHGAQPAHLTLSAQYRGGGFSRPPFFIRSDFICPALSQPVRARPPLYLYPL